MNVIWKYVLELTDVQEIEMPQESAILSVGLQGNSICMWCLVNPEKQLVKNSFAVIGTGNPIEIKLGNFIGTVQQGPFVWHIFQCN